MKQETISTGRTIEAAVSNGAAELGVDSERVTYEVLEQPKKGFLGFGEVPAKVKVIYTPTPEDSALEFIRNLIENMGIDAQVELAHELTPSGDRLIRITGAGAGVLIGHHGDTLDSLQCLCSLAANRGEEESGGTYTRITVDIEDYRAKREESLRRLARSMAVKVRKYRKNITLEPMNPYERRIIHSEIQNIEGVSTMSVGSESNRRVVIYLEDKSRTQNPPRAERPAAKPYNGARRPAPQFAKPISNDIANAAAKNAMAAKTADIDTSDTESDTGIDDKNAAPMTRYGDANRPPRPKAEKKTREQAFPEIVAAEREAKASVPENSGDDSK
ncbi:MAG: RNA-binding cell elongation regulator Jag/EloR [Eubacteriales bacterium]